MSDPMGADERRLEAILEVLLRLARRDFSVRCEVSDALDTIDAIATGFNMMADELSGKVVARSDLMASRDALRDAETRLLHVSRLAAIGQLASGVAHEVNNPAGWALLSLDTATRTLGRAQKSLAETPSAEPAVRLVGEAEEAVARARDGLERIRIVVADLLLFARTRPENELVILDEVIETSCRLVAPAVAEHATIRFDRGLVAPIHGSRSRLGQVVTNLVANAAHALRDSGRKGEIRIRTANEPSANEPRTVHLVVEDTGPGVPEEIRDRVFDPFFTTTKDGTGLGLSLVSEIVVGHGGYIRVSDSEMGGAKFEVCLPVAVERAPK